jgi:hypothetical protein
MPGEVRYNDVRRLCLRINYACILRLPKTTNFNILAPNISGVLKQVQYDRSITNRLFTAATPSSNTSREYAA